MDRYYAWRLKACTGVTLHPHPARAHNLVKHLRNVGSLQAILRQTLDEPIVASRAA